MSSDEWNNTQPGDRKPPRQIDGSDVLCGWKPGERVILDLAPGAQWCKRCGEEAIRGACPRCDGPGDLVDAVAVLFLHEYRVRS